MSARSALIERFLTECGWDGAERGLLAGDASFRRYDRITRSGQQAVLMDAPPEHEDVRPFVKIADFLTRQGFSAPKILGQDVQNGFLLLEDLGDNTYTRLLKNGHDERTLYQLAMEALVALHRLDVLPDELPPYDAGKLETEVLLLTDWWMPAAFEQDTPETVRQDYIDLWQPLFRKVQPTRPVLVMRDFHVDNLLLLQGRNGMAACGLLDFQDALAGHPAYDIMSLLEDARRDIDAALIKDMKSFYFKCFPDIDQAAYEEAHAILAAQRHAKVIGIFTRLCVRDKKPVYLHHIPRVWRLFEAALDHPALDDLKQWVDTTIPTHLRGIPACLT